jgi:hypothetical protein
VFNIALLETICDKTHDESVKYITLIISKGRASLTDFANLVDIWHPINSRRGIDSHLTGATLDLVASRNVSNPCLVGHLKYALDA